jgi:MoxR-like ATPase
VPPVFRHRLLIGYRAEAEGISVDTVIQRLIQHVPIDGGGKSRDQR